MDAFNWKFVTGTGEELLKIYKPFFVEVCIKWVSAIMFPKMFVPEMSTVPKCLFP